MIKNIFSIYNYNDIFIIKYYKELSYYLISININIASFMKYLIDYIIDDISIVNKKKYELIDFISSTEYLIIKSYYKIMYYEYLFINIYNIIKI